MWALINHGIVTETTEMDPEGRFHASLVWVKCGADVSAGWSYDATGFKPPDSAGAEQPQLMTCTPAQGLVALFALKQIREDNILAAIAQIADPVLQYTARIGYQRATSWDRNSPTMQTMAQLLQLTETDLDELFSYAAGVNV